VVSKIESSLRFSAEIDRYGSSGEFEGSQTVYGVPPRTTGAMQDRLRVTPHRSFFPITRNLFEYAEEKNHE
jgi:hypothetical protein